MKVSGENFLLNLGWIFFFRLKNVICLEKFSLLIWMKMGFNQFYYYSVISLPYVKVNSFSYDLKNFDYNYVLEFIKYIKKF